VPLTSNVSPFMIGQAYFSVPRSAFPARPAASFGCGAFCETRGALRLATVQASALPSSLFSWGQPVRQRSGIASEPTSVLDRKGLTVLGRICSPRWRARVAELPSLKCCFVSTASALLPRANLAVERTHNGGSRLACSPTGGGAVARRSPLR
jgi:hypothetical protein